MINTFSLWSPEIIQAIKKVVVVKFASKAENAIFAI